MEKISSILPGSSRVTSVDLKESSPVRSSVPTFGRAEAPQGRERPSVDAMKPATSAQAEMHDWRAKDLKHASIAKDLSDKFFAKNKVDVEEAPIHTEDRFASMTAESGGKLTRAREMFEENEAMQSEIEAGVSNPEARSQQPAGLHPKGSFINYVA